MLLQCRMPHAKRHGRAPSFHDDARRYARRATTPREPLDAAGAAAIRRATVTYFPRAYRRGAALPQARCAIQQSRDISRRWSRSRRSLAAPPIRRMVMPHYRSSPAYKMPYNLPPMRAHTHATQDDIELVRCRDESAPSPPAAYQVLARRIARANITLWRVI